MKIVRNSVKCLKCNKEVESKHRHDFVSCDCGNVFTDGGKEYCRRGAIDMSLIQDTSIYEEA